MSRAALFIAMIVVRTAIVSADGGAVCARESRHGLEVTIFTAPVPPIAGPIDVSVFVKEDARDAPILDGAVDIALAGPGDVVIRAGATREQATNKLLYAAAIELPSAGHWRLDAVVAARGKSVEVGCDLDAREAPSGLWKLWPYLVLPPVAVLLFALRRRVASR